MVRNLEVTDRQGIQALYDNLITKHRNGWSVADPDSGSCKIVIDTGSLGENENTIAVTDGTVLAAGDRVTKESQESIGIPMASSAPRQDTIALNPDGSVAYYKGTEEPLRPNGRSIKNAERPSPPDLKGENVVPLGVVTVPRETDHITDGNIIDLRVGADLTLDELRVLSEPSGPKSVLRDEDLTIRRATDYGADPSGETASTDALQQAINAADPGDRIKWGQPGRYYLDGEIDVPKRVEIDLHEGVVESDYHDEQAYPNDQSHYMPLFRVHGTIGSSQEIEAYVDRGEDHISVPNPGEFEVGEYVILRNHDTNRTTVPAYDYFPTQSRIREIEDGVIYLEDDALRDYSSGDYLTHAEFVSNPVIRNVHIRPRTEPTFDSDAGKVLGGFRHGIATEATEDVLIDNCSAAGYDSHIWSSRDDISPTYRDCRARDPMNLSGSCGEPIHIEGSRSVSIVRPMIKEARRAIDARTSGGKITVEEPDITGVSFVGISWHSTSNVDVDIEIRGGHVRCRPDDPTMDNKDGSEDVRQEVQAGRPFNTGVNGKFIAEGVTFVGRQDGLLNGATQISGGEIYKYRTAGTALTLDGEDITIEGTEIGSYGRIDRLLGTDADTNAANCTLENVVFNCDGTPSRAIEILGGDDISISGRVTSGSSACVDIEGGDNLDFDLDTNADGNYAYIIYGGTDISIEGDIDGSAANEVIRIDGGTGIDIDADNTASGATDSRGVRILGGTDIDISGRYSGDGIGVMFSGSATSVNVHDMRVEVTSDRSAALGSDGGSYSITNLKFINNDLTGTVENILMNNDVDGLWAINNIASTVEYTSGTVVGQVFGNGADAAEVITTEHSTDEGNPHNVTADQADAVSLSGDTMTGPLSWEPGNRPVMLFNPDEGGTGRNGLFEFINATNDARNGWFGWYNDDDELQITYDKNGGTRFAVGDGYAALNNDNLATQPWVNGLSASDFSALPTGGGTMTGDVTFDSGILSKDVSQGSLIDVNLGQTYSQLVYANLEGYGGVAWGPNNESARGYAHTVYDDNIGSYLFSVRLGGDGAILHDGDLEVPGGDIITGGEVQAPEAAINGIDFSNENSGDIHVNPVSGDDSNSGSLSNPLATIEEALNRLSLVPRGSAPLTIDLYSSAADAGESFPITYDEDPSIGPILGSGDYPHLQLRLLGNPDDRTDVEIGSFMASSCIGVKSIDVQDVTFLRQTPHFDSDAAVIIGSSSEVQLDNVGFNPDSPPLERGVEVYGGAHAVCEKIDVTGCDIGISSKRESQTLAKGFTGEAESHVYHTQGADLTYRNNSATSGDILYYDVFGSSVHEVAEKWHMVDETDGPFGLSTTRSPLSNGQEGGSWDELKIDYQFQPSTSCTVGLKFNGVAGTGDYEWFDQAGQPQSGDYFELFSVSSGWDSMSGTIKLSGRDEIGISHDFRPGAVSAVNSYGDCGSVEEATGWPDELTIEMIDGSDGDQITGSSSDYLEIWGKQSSAAWR